MSTKIRLQLPYSNDFKSGYLNTNKEPRRVVLLVRNDNTKTSTSYARYLMACNLKRYLLITEHVDHIDNNQMNDTLSNLQIMSPKENNIKKNINLNISKSYITLICPICRKEFTKDCRNINHKIKKLKKPTCSRICGGKMSHITLSKK